jgi:hypothetical protein
MAHLASSFSSQQAGTLEVLLQGVYYQSSRRDAGFLGDSTSSNPSNVLIKGYAGPVGGRMYTQPIDRYAPNTTTYFEYPGSGVVWEFGTELVANTSGSLSGFYSYGIIELRMELTLRWTL